MLAHLFRMADVPVEHLSIAAPKTMKNHYDLAAKLNERRRHGVMIASSGNVLYNLRRVEWSIPDAEARWGSGLTRACPGR